MKRYVLINVGTGATAFFVMIAIGMSSLEACLIGVIIGFISEKILRYLDGA